MRVKCLYDNEDCGGFIMDIVLSILSDYGLFVGLVAYVIWDSHTREKRLTATIKELREYVITLLNK